MQKILSISTRGDSLRSPVDGLTFEDGDNIRPDKEIGLSLNGRCPFYQTVMHAVADGWKLLAPPRHEYTTEFEGKEIDMYDWWLVKD